MVPLQDIGLRDLIEVAAFIGTGAVAYYRLRQVEKRADAIEDRTKQIENGWSIVREKMALIEASLGQIKEQMTEVKVTSHEMALGMAEVSKSVAILAAFANRQVPVGNRSNERSTERPD